MTYDKNLKMLLVEDSKFTRKMEIQIARNMGLSNILEADDGNQAIQILQSGEQIDLIVSDWHMPNKDGFELLVWVRASAEHRDIPFILATAQAEKKQIAAAKEAGVTSLIPKPFTADDLREKIEQAFSGEEVEEQQAAVRQTQRTSDGRVVLRIAHIQITDHLVLGVLKHLISIGELQPKHFALETVRMPGWNPVQKELEQAELDGALVLAPIAMDLFGFGVPIRLVLLAHKNGSIFVRRKDDGNGGGPEAFRDKIFYIPHRLSIHNMLSHMYLTELGLRPGVPGQSRIDVQMEVVPPIKMPEFLSSNPNSCGFMVAEPLGTKAIASNFAELQFLSAEVWRDHPCCVVVLRQEVIDNHREAVQELVNMLVYAGKYIDSQPGKAAEVGVGFLDPDGSLGLNASVLKNVLTEPAGIKTNDLYPVVEDLEYLQTYMSERMDIGSRIDLDKFVDLRFAKVACGGGIPRSWASTHLQEGTIIQRVAKSRSAQVSSKTMLDKEGQYLLFRLGEEEYGIGIRNLKEIVGMMPISSVPNMPDYVEGVINLRDKIIPVLDLRTWFGMEKIEYHSRTAIMVVEMYGRGGLELLGLIVDEVAEVVDIPANDIEEAPGLMASTGYILALAKVQNRVKILLNTARLVS